MVGFTIDTVFNEARLLSRCRTAFFEAAAALGDAIRKDCGIYVPYDTGTLYRSVLRSAVAEKEERIGCDVVWSAPYASAVYYGDARGVRYHTEHHPHARARWFEGASASCGDAWSTAVQASVSDGLDAERRR